ncbi:MAG: hypothetical protein MZV70_51395 [Desulfobacterales bacterium]|nr:hypothetical protein [Desulfobacterales bacterium]
MPPTEQAPRHGRDGSAEHPRRNDELVVLAQGVRQGRHFLRYDGGGQRPAAQPRVVPDGCYAGSRTALRAHVDSEQFVHDPSSFFDGVVRGSMSR